MARGKPPTKYTPEMLNSIETFFDEAVPTNMRIPTVEGMCLKLNISKNTVYMWAKKHDPIKDALKLIKIKQKEYLTEVGIFGGKEINASIVSLFLKANHGMIETEKKLLAGDSGSDEIKIRLVDAKK